MKQKKNESRILREVQETAQGLYTTGVISKHRMGEFSALCNLENPRQENEAHHANPQRRRQKESSL